MLLIQEKFPENNRSTADALQKDLAATTDAAAAQGKHDVHAAAQTGQSYLDQAKLVAGSALATAQGYVQAGQNKLQNSETAGDNGNAGVTGTLASAAGTALGVTKNALSYAQETLQPHVDSAKAAAQPHIDNAANAAQPYVDSAKGTAQSAIDTTAPYMESAKSTAQKAIDTASPYVQSAKETVQPYAQKATDAAKPYVNSAKETVQDKTPDSERVNPSCEG